MSSTGPRSWPTGIAFFEQIKQRSYKARTEIRQKMIKSVAAAKDQLREIGPDMCVRYTEAWRDDLEQWGARLESLSSPGSIEKALEELELL